MIRPYNFSPQEEEAVVCGVFFNPMEVSCRRDGDLRKNVDAIYVAKDSFLFILWRGCVILVQTFFEYETSTFMFFYCFCRYSFGLY